MPNNYLKMLIHNKFHLLSKSEQKLSEYFLQLDEDLINKTIANLSTETGYSQTTVFNFVKKLGFEGFQEFKIKLASNISSENYNKSNVSLTVYSEITSEDSVEVVAEKIINFNQNSLSTLYETLDKKKIESTLGLIKNVKNLYFFGVGGSSVVAYDSFHKFLRTNYTCNYITDYHLQLISSTRLTKNDGVFIFSHSGESIETINLVKQIKKTDAIIITLTGNPGSELIELSDESIIVYSEESKFRTESLVSRILYLTVMDIIYTSVMYKNNDMSFKAFKKVRDAISVTRIDK